MTRLNNEYCIRYGEVTKNSGLLLPGALVIGSGRVGYVFRNLRADGQLLQRSCTSLGSSTVLIAATAGGADRPDDLAVDDDGYASVYRDGTREPE